MTELSTARTPREAPVAIVGAGPVGLALANELGWRGIPHLLIEQRTERLDFPTAESVHTRTMEIARRWGLADRIRFSGFPPDLPRDVIFVTTLSGYGLGRVARHSNREQQVQNGEISPEGALWCPKFLFDRVLWEGAEETGQTTFLTGRELVDVEGDETLALTLRDVTTGEETHQSVRYLAICEGASSPTRKRLGIKMEGTFAEGRNLGIYFRSAQLAEIMAQQHGVMADIINPGFSANLTSVDGNDRWRLIFFQRDSDPALLDPVDCVTRAVGHPIDTDILDARVWSGHSAVASRLSSGNTFLLGDAGNLRWPRGGFGMNTGVGDVGNLGWKLEAVLKGWGGAALLDSYEEERRPIALATVKEAAASYRSEAALKISADLLDDDEAGAAARRSLGELILTTRLREWNTLGVQLGQIYEDSPINLDDGDPPPPYRPDQYLPTTRPGARAPHFWLRPGTSILDSFGSGYCLVHGGTEADVAPIRAAAEKASIPFRAVHIEHEAHLRLYERLFVLVRPDGHVCWRGDAPPADPVAVLRRVSGNKRDAMQKTSKLREALHGA